MVALPVSAGWHKLIWAGSPASHYPSTVRRPDAECRRGFEGPRVGHFFRGSASGLASMLASSARASRMLASASCGVSIVAGEPGLPKRLKCGIGSDPADGGWHSGEKNPSDSALIMPGDTIGSEAAAVVCCFDMFTVSLATDATRGVANAAPPPGVASEGRRRFSGEPLLELWWSALPQEPAGKRGAPAAAGSSLGV